MSRAHHRPHRRHDDDDNRDRGPRHGAGRLRIVAGRFGGRWLQTLPDRRVRPMPEKTRAALFNSLHNRGLLDDAHVLDAFAGSGALGVEALSRGARHVTFIERDRGVFRQLQANLASLGAGPDETRLIHADSLVDRGASLRPWLVARAGDPLPPVVLLLLDPPYDMLREPDAPGFVAAMGELLAAVVVAPPEGVERPLALVALGHDNDVAVPPALGPCALVETRAWGRTHISFYGDF